MTEMFDFGWSERPYWDRKNWSSLEAYKDALKTSSTLYVGNLSFYTQEAQIYALFDQVNHHDHHPKDRCGTCPLDTLSAFNGSKKYNGSEWKIGPLAVLES